MRMSLGKKIALALTAVLLIPIFLHQSTAVASAATPKFAKNNVTIAGQGVTYQLKIKNTVKGSTYKWSTSDIKIVTITSKGLVTTVDKGTATIKCKIIYPSKKTKILTCPITVTIPVQTIKIKNANEVNGANQLLIGQSYKFTCDVTPVNTSDIVSWSAEGDDKDCIKVDADGTVTGIKAGKAILVATAGTGSAAIKDQKIVEVAQPKATVKSVDFVDANTIKVVFDSSIDSSTLIGSNSKLLDNISISLKKNAKNILANDPGTLKGALSSDLTTLTITSANMFSGDYSIIISNKIKTTNGIAIEEATKQISYSDNVGPSIATNNVDDSGMINTITFTEAINRAELQVFIASITSSAGTTATCDAATKNYITNAANYTLSDDKKTLSINLSRINSTDFGKVFHISLYGIKDLAGNSSSPFTLPVTILTDNSTKPQAQVVSLTRTGYNTLTALFDRAVQYPGMATVNGAGMSGSVDTSNSKKVNYTMSDTQAALTGTQLVTLSGWNGYNVTTGQFSTSQTLSVNFTVNTIIPVVQTFDYDSASGILTLTYNEDVSLTTTSGVFVPRYQTAAGVILNNLTVPYVQVASTDSKIIKLKISLPQLGSYTFTLNPGFVKDNFRNSSLSGTVNISNADGKTNELPGPYSISQSPIDSSQIILEFANMLNINTAQTVSNYSIAGLTILSAQVTKNTPDTGATVVLTVAEGSIDEMVARPVMITGLKDYSGAYAPISNYTSTVTLRENKKATLVNSTFDLTSKKVICLNFSEQIKGSISLSVTQANLTSPIMYSTSVSISGNNVYITLGNTPPSGAYLRVDIFQNNITDLNGNAVSLASQLFVPVQY